MKIITDQMSILTFLIPYLQGKITFCPEAGAGKKVTRIKRTISLGAWPSSVSFLWQLANAMTPLLRSTNVHRKCHGNLPVKIRCVKLVTGKVQVSQKALQTIPWESWITVPNVTSICGDVVTWTKVLGRQMDRLTNTVMTNKAKMIKVSWQPLSAGKVDEMTQWNHMPSCDHCIPRHSTATIWLHLNSLSQWWLKLKLLKCRDRPQKRRIFTSRIISLVAACSTNAFLSGKPCSSKFN